LLGVARATARGGSAWCRRGHSQCAAPPVVLQTVALAQHREKLCAQTVSTGRAASAPGSPSSCVMTMSWKLLWLRRSRMTLSQRVSCAAGARRACPRPTHSFKLFARAKMFSLSRLVVWRHDESAWQREWQSSGDSPAHPARGCRSSRRIWRWGAVSAGLSPSAARHARVGERETAQGIPRQHRSSLTLRQPCHSPDDDRSEDLCVST
jgi:hypothetical protein